MTAHQNKANRKYQDSLFRFLFGTHRNREFTLSLYNTLNHTDYTNADDIEFVTLNDGMLFCEHEKRCRLYLLRLQNNVQI